MKLPKSLEAKRDEQARILIGKYPEYPVTDPYDFKTGYNAAIKDLINSDALVSMYDALLGHYPKQDAIAKWNKFLEGTE